MGIFTECSQCVLLKAEVKELQAEIERLRLSHLETEKEIARLRKELVEKDDYIRTVSQLIGAHSYE